MIKYIFCPCILIILIFPVKTFSQVWHPHDNDSFMKSKYAQSLDKNEIIVGVRYVNSDPALLILDKGTIKKSGLVLEAVFTQIVLNTDIPDNEGIIIMTVLCDCYNSQIKIVKLLTENDVFYDDKAKWAVAVGDSTASRMLKSVCN